MASTTLTASTEKILSGHRDLRDRLARGLRDGRAAHAHLFAGPSGVGKTAVALEYARLLLCDDSGSVPCGRCRQCEASSALQHPDLHLIFPYPPGVIKVKKGGEDADEIDESGAAEKIAELTAALAEDAFGPTMLDSEERAEGSRFRMQNHSIRLPQIRGLLRQVARKAYQAKRKVYVLFHAETLNTAAQNALLKALEEPPPDGYFLLIAENDQEILPTIRSRCQAVRMGKLEADVIADALTAGGVAAEQAHIAAQLSNGSFKRARDLAGEDLAALQADVINFLAQSAICNPLELPETVAGVQERLAATDRSYFDFLNLFFRDAELHRSLGLAAQTRVAFESQQKRIAGIVQAYPGADFEAAMRAVDGASDQLSLGYSSDMVLYALAIRIHNALGPRTQAARAKPNG